VPAYAEQGVSAPPEVAYGTAADPARQSAWLPPQLRQRAATSIDGDELQASWTEQGGPWSAVLRVYPAQAGGATLRLELDADLPHEQLVRIADETLASLAGAVTDNLNAG
jgi:hypothetical protein